MSATKRPEQKIGRIQNGSPAARDFIVAGVSTANDDLHDRFFVNPDIGRFPELLEDEPAATSPLHPACSESAPSSAEALRFRREPGFHAPV